MDPSLLGRELRFQLRSPAFLLWMGLVFVLSSLAVGAGILEVAQQRATLETLLAGDAEDRADALGGQSDWGGAAYYSFHLTYDPPSDFAFAALGVRDREPWKHRVRMLALEGQIYEHDAGNPVLALTGRFDFAFFAAFVLPLILAVLLHDLKASERSAGRYALLVTMSGRESMPWRARALLRSAAVFLAAGLPLVIAATLSGSGLATTLFALLALLAHTAFWGLVCSWMAAWERPAPVLLSSLVGVWILLAVVVPATGKLAIDRLVEAPSGAEILMTQREAVNGAWDVPTEVTMEAFVARHPEWADHAEIEGAFEWKWYYAFQQVGDQKAEPLARAYRDARLTRDRISSYLAWLSPPALLERSFQRLARTDLAAALAYESRVRAFHARLREYYYDKLFLAAPFEESALEEFPQFDATQGDS
jgi:ABC-2 type transport system permease protein